MVGPPPSQDAESPVALILVLTFAWAWILWSGSMLLRSQQLVVMPLVMFGGFGTTLATDLGPAFQASASPHC